MKKVEVGATLVFLCAAGFAVPAMAQQNSVPGVPVSTVVTLEPRRSKELPTVEKQDIQVTEAGQQREVTDFKSLADSRTQLLLMIDDSARGTFNTEIPTLKKFITSLAANFEVGVGYMRNGMTQMTAEFTKDHNAAANGIRVAMGPGGADVSPYDSLADAVKKWPKPEAERKEVIMISGGVEGLGGGFISDNPYVMAGIQAAQKAGVVVYAIYSPSVGHFGHDYWQWWWGQNFLSELADATGGEFYTVGYGSPVSFQPYLQQILELQSHQYLLTFVAGAEKKAGLQPLRVAIPNKDASVAFPAKVFVRASM
jgi:hypothetical protein